MAEWRASPQPPSGGWFVQVDLLQSSLQNLGGDTCTLQQEWMARSRNWRDNVRAAQFSRSSADIVGKRFQM